VSCTHVWTRRYSPWTGRFEATVRTGRLKPVFVAGFVEQVPPQKLAFGDVDNSETFAFFESTQSIKRHSWYKFIELTQSTQVHRWFRVFALFEYQLSRDLLCHAHPGKAIPTALFSEGRSSQAREGRGSLTVREDHGSQPVMRNRPPLGPYPCTWLLRKRTPPKDLTSGLCLGSQPE
jgi:hypothetical protein